MIAIAALGGDAANDTEKVMTGNFMTDANNARFA
jgi:hypothetical protein